MGFVLGFFFKFYVKSNVFAHSLAKDQNEQRVIVRDLYLDLQI